MASSLKLCEHKQNIVFYGTPFGHVIFPTWFPICGFLNTTALESVLRNAQYLKHIQKIPKKKLANLRTYTSVFAYE